MKYILIDTHWQSLLPLTFTRPVSELLIGIDTIADKWTRHLGAKPGVLTAPHLRKKFPFQTEANNVFINSAVIPSRELIDTILNLPEGTVLTHLGKFIAAYADRNLCEKIAAQVGGKNEISFTAFPGTEKGFAGNLLRISQAADLFALNDAVLRQDFEEITKKFRTTDPGKDIIVKGKDLFVEESAVLNHCVLNTETGPIYIGEGAEIMEGSMIRGPFALGAQSTVKMGTKIYGATSVGAQCKVGGEISNSIVHAYSNKGHDGFLGNSVIGSWCNLGADTNTSNLKNNYGKVRVWQYPEGDFADSGRLFHGLVMGDHSKAGINTMFNTGTVVGGCANIFDAGFPPKFVPSFSWGSANAFSTFKIEKAFEAAEAMMGRRNLSFDETEKDIFRFIYEFDAHLRENHG